MYEEEGKDDSASVESVSRDRGGGMLDGDERRQNPDVLTSMMMTITMQTMTIMMTMMTYQL